MRPRARGLFALACLPALPACRGEEPAVAGAPGDVVISEIMYHPVLDDGPSEDHEFVEVYNRSDHPVALPGWRLGGGVRFVFPAGVVLPARGALVVAKNRERLVADVPAYHLAPGDVLGNYDGQLDNGGERLVLADAAGAVVDEVEYDDAFPWPAGADALGAGEDWLAPELLPLEQHRFMGRSLERTSPDRPGKQVASWAASPLDGANPGRRPAAGAPGAVVEALTVTAGTVGGTSIRAGEMALARVVASAGPLDHLQIESFVDEVDRADEPRVRTPFTREGTAWEASLPAQRAGSIVRYRVLGDRGRGLEPLAPRDSDPAPFFAYFVRRDLPGDTPAYELFIATDDWAELWDNIAAGRVPGNGNGTNPFACALNERWNARVPAVAVVDGRVYDVRARYEGSFQNRANGAVIDVKKWPATVPRPDRPAPFRALSWSLKFPRYAPLEGRRTVILNKLAQSCHGFNTLVGNALFERAGVPAAQAQHVRLYINGAYYHYVLRMEHFDEDFVRRAFPREDIGDLFKAVGGRWDEGPYGYADERVLEEYCGYSLDQRYAASYDRGTHEDWKSGGAEVRALIEGLAAARAEGGPAMRAFFERTFALEEVHDYMAVIDWMVAWDDQYHNHFLYRRAADGRWLLLPTDLDNVMGGAAPSLFDASFFAGQWNVRSNRNDYWNHLKDAYLRAFRSELIERVRALDRTVLDPNAVAALVDEVTAAYRADEALASPAGVSCGRDLDEIKRIKDFAYARSARVAAGLFD